MQWRFLDAEQAKKAEKKHPEFKLAPFTLTHSVTKNKNKADSWTAPDGTLHASSKSSSGSAGGAFAGFSNLGAELDDDDDDDDDGIPLPEKQSDNGDSKTSEKPQDTQPADTQPEKSTTDTQPEKQPTDTQPQPVDQPTPRRRSLRA